MDQLAVPGRHKIRQLAVNSPEGKARMRRARAAITAIKRGADHELALSYVIWPTPLIHHTQAKKAA